MLIMIKIHVYIRELLKFVADIRVGIGIGIGQCIVGRRNIWADWNKDPFTWPGINVHCRTHRHITAVNYGRGSVSRSLSF